MKILVIAPQPFFASRGTPLSVYHRTLFLARQGATIDLLVYGCGKDVELPDTRIVRIPRLPFLEPVPIGPSWRKLFHDGLMILWTIGLLLRNRYQAVDAHEEAVFWCRFLKPIFRFKLIYDMHSSLPQQLTNFRFSTSRVLIGTFQWLENICLGAADVVITVCPDLRDQVLKSGFPPERHLMIENSVSEDIALSDEPQPFAPSIAQVLTQLGKTNPVILYAGTFEVYQGVEMLVEAFSRLIQQRPDCRLLLVGGTDAQTRVVRELANSLGLDDICIVTGHVPRAVVADCLRCATVVVSSRLIGTNTPLKIYEYLASGKPIIATRIWSHTQVLDDSVSWLVEPDVASLAAGLLASLTDEAGSTDRVHNALALFKTRYSPHEYEWKIRRVLEILA